MACVAEGRGLGATARVFAVEATTVVPWGGDTAEQLRAFSSECFGDLPLEQVPRDAVYAVRRDGKAGELSTAEASKRLARSPSWGWTGMEPTSQWLVAVAVGSRPLAMVPRVGHPGPQRWAPGGGPLCVTEGLQDSAPALLTPCGPWRHPERRPDKGPRPKPRWRPLPKLRYAQVLKSCRRRGGGTHRVVCSTPLAIDQRFATCGWPLNTAVVERLHRAIRQRVAAISRRGNTRGQGATGGREQLVLCQVAHTFVVPHASRRPR